MSRVASTLDGLKSMLDIARKRKNEVTLRYSNRNYQNETKTYRKKELKLTEHQCALGQLQEGVCVFIWSL